MKSFRTLLLSILTLFVFLSGSHLSVLQAQQADAKKKIVIVKKTVDENGKEVIEETVMEGDEAEAFHKKMKANNYEEDETGKEMEVEVTVDKTTSKTGD